MRRFGKYLLERQLAIGGMAEIFLAHQHGPAGFAKRLVIKRILPHHANDQQFTRMFLAEARTSAKLNHPNIVQIYELGECDGAYYIAMEYIRGESLAKLIRRLREYKVRLPPYIAAKIIATTCDGIDYAHNFCDVDDEPLHLVHRNLSPDNILVSFSGGVKVIDFGIAKVRNTGAEDDSGLVKGKFCYMSPEQITGRRVDRRSDIFSLGLVLYELTTLGKPFGEGLDLTTIDATVNDPPTHAKEWFPEYPTALWDIVHRCLRKRRDERFSTAHELQYELQTFVHSGGEYVSEREVGQYVKKLFSGSADDIEWIRAQSTGKEQTGSAGDSRIGTNEPIPGKAPVEHGPVVPRRMRLSGAHQNAMEPSRNFQYEPIAPGTTHEAANSRKTTLIFLLLAALGAAGWFAQAQGWLESPLPGQTPIRPPSLEFISSGETALKTSSEPSVERTSTTPIGPTDKRLRLNDTAPMTTHIQLAAQQKLSPDTPYNGPTERSPSFNNNDQPLGHKPPQTTPAEALKIPSTTTAQEKKEPRAESSSQSVVSRMNQASPALTHGQNEAADIVQPDTNTLKSSGTLKVLGASKQFVVFVDGKRRGTTPFELDLEAGDHLVVAILDAWRQPFNITVKNDETTILRPRPPVQDTRPALQGIIRFDIPSGYRVTLDRESVPARPHRLVSGTYGVGVHDPKTGRRTHFSVHLEQSNPVALIRDQ